MGARRGFPIKAKVKTSATSKSKRQRVRKIPLGHATIVSSHNLSPLVHSVTKLADKLSLDERQSLLIKASEQYMRGDITFKAYRQAEAAYRPDYKSAVQELARSKQSLRSALQRLVSRSNEE